MPISVVFVDDHQSLLSALKARLAKVEDIEVVGETNRGDDVEALNPDVLVLDLTMPGTDGLEVLRQLAEKRAAARVVILSMHTTPSYAARAVKLGALGYVGKDAPSSELLRAIRAAASGNRYLAPPLSDASLLEYEHRLDSTKLDLFDTLSNRERQVMKQTAMGLTSRQIGEHLSISRRTVESYLANVSEKLGIKTRADLIRYAVRMGLVTADED